MIQYQEAQPNRSCQGVRRNLGNSLGEDMGSNRNSYRRVYIYYRMSPLGHNMWPIDAGEQTRADEFKNFLRSTNAR